MTLQENNIFILYKNLDVFIYISSDFYIKDR